MAEFVYYNNNPAQRNEDDCVTRAISLGVGEDYEIISEKLTLISELLECDRLNVCCYKHLIEYVYECEPVDCEGMTVEEFADENNYGVFLVRIPEHITCIIDGKIYDTWDCRDYFCDLAWFVCE